MKEQVSKFNENAEKRGAESPHGTEEVFRVDHGRQVFFPGFPPSLKRFSCVFGAGMLWFIFSGLYQGLELGKQGWMVFNSWLHSPNPTASRIEVEGVFLGFRLEPKLMSGKDVCVTESFFITHWLEREREREREIGKLLCIKKGSQQLQ